MQLASSRESMASAHTRFLFQFLAAPLSDLQQNQQSRKLCACTKTSWLSAPKGQPKNWKMCGNDRSIKILAVARNLPIVVKIIEYFLFDNFQDVHIWSAHLLSVALLTSKCFLAHPRFHRKVPCFPYCLELNWRSLVYAKAKHQLKLYNKYLT